MNQLTAIRIRDSENLEQLMAIDFADLDAETYELLKARVFDFDRDQNAAYDTLDEQVNEMAVSAKVEIKIGNTTHKFDLCQ